MSTQWKIDIILNTWLTRIRLKLSYTIYPLTPIKSKIVAKILSEHVKTSFDHQFSIQ